jgi:pSer/pThr/pTyr-binding forkhead associated (FHA) protein
VFQVEIEDDEGNHSVIPVTRPEISIGREAGNAIRLTDRNVSRTHAKLHARDDMFTLEDLSSYTGTRVNGTRIDGQTGIVIGDVIRIGDYELRVLNEAGLASRNRRGEDSQVTQIDNTSPGNLSNQVPLIMDDDEDPTAVINLRAGLGPELTDQAHEGLIDGPPARLVVVSRQLAGSEYLIDRSPTRIGRGSHCELQIDHRSISRHHATIEWVTDQFIIRDSGSANGISVNGEQYSETQLHAGDRIDLGHIQVRFFPPGQIPEFAQGMAMGSRPRSSVLVTTILASTALIAVAGIFVLNAGPSAEDSASTTPPVRAVSTEKRWVNEVERATDNKRWSQVVNLLTHPPDGVDVANYGDQLETARTEETSSRALEEATKHEARKDWGMALEQLQSIKAGSVYYNEAQQRVPGIVAHYVRAELDTAQAALRTGDTDRALGHFELAEVYAPNNPRIPEMRALIQKSQAEATEEVVVGVPPSRPRNRAVPKPAKAAPKAPRVTVKQLINKSNRYLYNGQAKRALPFLEKALRKAPNNPQIHRGLGIAYATLGQDAAARKHYLRYLKLAPSAADAADVRNILGLD